MQGRFLLPKIPAQRCCEGNSSKETTGRLAAHGISNKSKARGPPKFYNQERKNKKSAHCTTHKVVEASQGIRCSSILNTHNGRSLMFATNCRTRIQRSEVRTVRDNYYLRKPPDHRRARTAPHHKSYLSWIERMWVSIDGSSWKQ